MKALKWLDILARLQTLNEIELQKPAIYMDDEQFITPITNFVSMTDDMEITHAYSGDEIETIKLETGDFCLGGDIW